MHTSKVDTHVHTSETSRCGKIQAKEAVRLYKEAGYDAIVITDHYYRGFFESLSDLPWEQQIDTYLSGYREALRLGTNLGLNVLLGMEMRFDESPNDYLVYGFDEEFLKNNPELFKLTLAQFRELTAGTGILVYQAHPFRPNLTPGDPHLLDGIEVFNGNPRHNSRNDLAQAYASKHGLKELSGSDFHQLPDLARGGIQLAGPVTTGREFAGALVRDQVTELLRCED